MWARVGPTDSALKALQGDLVGPAGAYNNTEPPLPPVQPPYPVCWDGCLTGWDDRGRSFRRRIT